MSQAAKLIQNGEVVAFPTDTVYGLGADARNEEAVKKIFQAKGRPADRALTVLIAEKTDLTKYTKDVSKEAFLLADQFWPGPLTIILDKKDLFAPSVSGHLKTVGLRMPNDPLALQFIKECGVPLAAPSANSTGRPSPTNAEHVLEDLDGKISGIIDGGETQSGIESTVLDLSNIDRPLILRPGGVTKSQLEKVIGREVFSLQDTSGKEESTAKHYEPVIPVYIVDSDWAVAIKEMQSRNESIGILASEELLLKYKDEAVEFYSLGKKEDIAFANKSFFKALRSLEKSSATVILAENYENHPSGEAYINRLKQAANKKRI